MMRRYRRVTNQLTGARKAYLAFIGAFPPLPEDTKKNLWMIYWAGWCARERYRPTTPSPLWDILMILWVVLLLLYVKVFLL